MSWYRYHRHFMKLSEVSPKPIISIFEAETDWLAVFTANLEDHHWTKFMNAIVEEGSKCLERGRMVKRRSKVFQRKEYVNIKAETKQHLKDIEAGKFGSKY